MLQLANKQLLYLINQGPIEKSYQIIIVVVDVKTHWSMGMEQ